jgi:hypothetical protein
LHGLGRIFAKKSTNLQQLSCAQLVSKSPRRATPSFGDIGAAVTIESGGECREDYPSVPLR